MRRFIVRFFCGFFFSDFFLFDFLTGRFFIVDFPTAFLMAFLIFLPPILASCGGNLKISCVTLVLSLACLLIAASIVCSSSSCFLIFVAVPCCSLLIVAVVNDGNSALTGLLSWWCLGMPSSFSSASIFLCFLSAQSLPCCKISFYICPLLFLISLLCCFFKLF